MPEFYFYFSIFLKYGTEKEKAAFDPLGSNLSIIFCMIFWLEIYVWHSSIGVKSVHSLHDFLIGNIWVSFVSQNIITVSLYPSWALLGCTWENIRANKWMNEWTKWMDGWSATSLPNTLECCRGMTWYDIRSSNIDENAASMPPLSPALACPAPSVLKSSGFLSPDIGWLHRIIPITRDFPDQGLME